MSEIGNIQKREITDEMRESYLDYAMSVIVARALPEPQRRFFGVVTMLIATLGVGMASWFLFVPLQNLSLPSVDDTAQVAEQATESAPADDAQFADASKIPQIGPIKGFIDSFNAVKDLLVSKDLQAATQGNATEAWTSTLSQWISGIAIRAKAFSQYSFDHTKRILNFLPTQALAYPLDILNKLISSGSRMSQ